MSNSNPVLDCACRVMFFAPALYHSNEVASCSPAIRHTFLSHSYPFGQEKAVYILHILAAQFPAKQRAGVRDGKGKQ